MRIIYSLGIWHANTNVNICPLQIVTMLKYLIDRRWWLLLPLQRISLIAPISDSWYIFFFAHFFRARKIINEHHSFPGEMKIGLWNRKKEIVSNKLEFFNTSHRVTPSFVTSIFIGSEKDSKFEWVFLGRTKKAKLKFIKVTF